MLLSRLQPMIQYKIFILQVLDSSISIYKCNVKERLCKLKYIFDKDGSGHKASIQISNTHLKFAVTRNFVLVKYIVMTHRNAPLRTNVAMWFGSKR